MTRLGIIPAAGQAVRIGGVPKELMPLSDTNTLLTHAVESLECIPCDRIMVITNQVKLPQHAKMLQDHRVGFALQHGTLDAWSAIVETFPYAGDWNYYMMPDTYQPKGFVPDYEHEINFGVFTTVHPERFGVLFDGEIYDKAESLKGSLQYAWGAVIWSRKVVEFWKTQDITGHTQAFNLAMKEFGYGTYPIPYYFDIAGMEDYRRLLEHVRD